MAESTVAAGYAKALLDFALSQRAHRGRLLDGADIRSSELDHQDSRLPMARYVALMRAAIVLCGNPALALEFGASSVISRFSIVGLITHASATMGEALEQSNRYVFGILSDHAQALLDSLDSAKTARGRVEALVIPLLHKGEVSMPAIAAELDMSRQTLYRKLKAEGISFEKVLGELRHRMSLHYLSGRKVSATETAYLVGFSDPSSFSRAFKRWTGRSPVEFTSPD